MNLQSDNNNQAQTNSAFNKLKAASKSVLQTMDTPQRATMAYPIPKEQWEAFQEYMQAVMMFQLSCTRSFPRWRRSIRCTK